MRCSIQSHQTVWTFSLLIRQYFEKYFIAVCSPVRLSISLQRFSVIFISLCLLEASQRRNHCQWSYVVGRLCEIVQFLSPFFLPECPSTRWKDTMTWLSAMGAGPFFPDSDSLLTRRDIFPKITPFEAVAATCSSPRTYLCIHDWFSRTFVVCSKKVRENRPASSNYHFSSPQAAANVPFWWS